MRAVIITRRALTDIHKARKFYEDQEAGAGAYFVRSIKEDITALSTLHGIHRCRHGFFQMIATVFPYSIYYREAEDPTTVVAVFDQRRDPQWIDRQLRSR